MTRNYPIALLKDKFLLDLQIQNRNGLSLNLASQTSLTYSIGPQRKHKT